MNSYFIFRVGKATVKSDNEDVEIAEGHGVIGNSDEAVTQNTPNELYDALGMTSTDIYTALNQTSMSPNGTNPSLYANTSKM
jgi:hypothetical protein